MLNKTLIAALLLVSCLPLLGVSVVSAEPEWLQLKVGDTFTVTSKGFAVTAKDGKITRESASVTFTAQITEVGEKGGVKFHVTEGTVTIESQTITMMSVDGNARFAPRLKGAIMNLHGSVTSGELRLTGRIHKTDGKIIVGLVGLLAQGSSLYSLRISGTLSR